MAQKAFSISQTPPYTIPAELYDEAYRLYQRKYLLWKNWLLEGILTLLTVDFIVTAVKDPSNGLTYFLMVLCVVLLALLIFHPLRIRRRVMDAVKEMGELPYVAALSEQEIVIQTLTEGEQGEEIPPTVLEYDEKMQIWEAEPFFLICEGKERFYVLPKKALYDEQIFAMRRFLRQKLSQLDRSCLRLEIFLFHVKQFCFGQKFEWNRFPSFCRKNRRIAKICSL